MATELPEKNTPEQTSIEEEELVVDLNAEDAEILKEVIEPVKTPEEQVYSVDAYRGLQRALSAKNKAYQSLKAQIANMTELQQELSRQGERQDLILDYLEKSTPFSEEEAELVSEPKETSLQRRRREIAEKAKNQPTVAQRRYQEQANRFFEEVRKVGLNPYDRDLQEFFGKLNGPDEALEKLPEYVKQATSKKSTETKVAFEEVITPLRARIDELETRLGLKTVEVGGPSGPGGASSLPALNEQFRKGEITPEEFQERSKELRKQGG